MGLSTERKVFVAILAVAGAALVIDQGLLGPSTVEAAPGAPAEASTPVLAGLTPVSSSGKPQSAAQILIDRLSSKSETSDPAPQATLSSAFSLEQLIEPVMQAMADQVEETPVAVKNTAPQRTTLPTITPTNVTLPSLSAVMPASNGGGAVLNGKLVRVGQPTPLGFTLKQVRERGVVLELEGRLYTVEIPMHTGP